MQPTVASYPSAGVPNMLIAIYPSIGEREGERVGGGVTVDDVDHFDLVIL